VALARISRWQWTVDNDRLHKDLRNLAKRHSMGNTIESWIYQPKGPSDPHIFFKIFEFASSMHNIIWWMQYMLGPKTTTLSFTICCTKKVVWPSISRCDNTCQNYHVLGSIATYITKLIPKVSYLYFFTYIKKLSQKILTRNCMYSSIIK
jgi:hypothetical protein